MSKLKAWLSPRPPPPPGGLASSANVLEFLIGASDVVTQALDLQLFSLQACCQAARVAADDRFAAKSLTLICCRSSTHRAQRCNRPNRGRQLTSGPLQCHRGAHWITATQFSVKHTAARSVLASASHIQAALAGRSEPARPSSARGGSVAAVGASCKPELPSLIPALNHRERRL